MVKKNFQLKHLVELEEAKEIGIKVGQELNCKAGNTYKKK